MEMGESVTVANATQAEGKCVICNNKHKDPKKEQIEKTVSKNGWERDKSMVGVFAWGDAKRMAIYPNASPPPYPTEGHHCLAFTSFIKENKDRCVRLNHFLNKVGFKANQPSNIIQLPDRHGNVAPNADPTASWPSGVKKEYKSYWVSIDLGHPLQLHLGRHRGEYFKLSDALYARMLGLAYDPDTCEQESMQDFEDGLKELSEGVVNHAFNQVVQGVWKCHPEHLRIAQSLYGKTGSHTDFYVNNAEKNKRQRVENKGYPGAGGQPTNGQNLSLDIGPL
ncbi:hypothetical protein BO221_13745 [Archangium sp. Cb G35]|uniref:hypothetical protein n=1 Tax=Archangium sp. Cb G35 TaxID=1920190 RepID=UPI0009373DEB|nr:hypothetical protein [Archangium sp. Cb G35]OJT24239.1 hypothetical protein BO221_13745 [Archangium sp. Cb G35]